MAKDNRTFKNQEEWERMKRLNPHLEDEFIDSPIVSNKSYAERHTELSLLKRKQRLEQKQLANKQKKALLVNKKLFMGPVLGMASSKIASELVVGAKSKGVSRIAMYSLNTWWATGQIILWLLSFVFILGGAGLATVADPAVKVLEWVGISVDSAILIFPGIAIALINAVLCLSLLGSILIAYKALNIEGLGGRGAIVKYILFIFAVVFYSLPIFQFAPWGLPWVWYVGKRPE